MTAEFTLLDCVDDGIIVVDSAFCVRYSNPGAASFLGASVESLAGRDLFDVVPSLRRTAHADDIRAAMAQSSRSRCASPFEFDHRSFELRMTPLPKVGLLLQFTDVTHRFARDRRMTESLSRLAHDLRNPLAPLRTSLELLNRPTTSEATKERARQIMGRQLMQMVDTIDRLQGISDEFGRSNQSGVPSQGLQSATSLAGAASSDMQVAALNGNGARVLVADDSALIQQSVVALLSAEGYEVRTVSDGFEAIAAANEWRPRYVLLDLHMPRLGGIEAARRLRQSHSAGQMTLLMMSGVTLDDSWRSHAKSAGFDACFDKSTDPVEWLDVMRRAGATVTPA